jgi:tetratricopeptide (TPR) repeat protein
MFADWNPDAANRGEVSAATVLRNAVRRVDRELRDQPDVLAAALSTLGELFTNIGAVATADSLLSRALAIQEAAGPSASTDLAATLARRGRLLMPTGRDQEALQLLQRALALHRTLFGSHRVETVRVQRDVALALRSLGEHSAAESELRSILAALPEADRDSPLSHEVASELGYALFLQARYDEAIALLGATLERQRATLGSQNAAVLLTTRFLASSLRDRGDLVAAERLYREALRVAQNLYGEAHGHTAHAKGVLSILLERKGDLAEAERLAREELAILEPDGPVTAIEVIRLGAIRLDRGDLVEAERLLRTGLDSLLRRHPSGRPDEADALNRLAYILLSRRALDADHWYDAAAAFDRDRPDDAPNFVSDGLHFLAWAHQRSAHLAAAESTYRKAYLLYRDQLPPGHQYLTFTRRELRRVLADLGRPGDTALFTTPRRSR